MSTHVNTGGPAFPLHNHGAQTLGLHLSGMTLRDYFAAKAMQALASSPHATKEWINTHLADSAWAIADAMLEARGA